MHVCVWVVGVAGWNTFPLLDWFGTLLGPEGTPVGVSRWTIPGLAGLTQPWCPCCGCGCGGGVGGWGVVVC